MIQKIWYIASQKGIDFLQEVRKENSPESIKTRN